MRITEEARDGWHEFAGRNGVSLTTLQEVLGRLLAEPDVDLATVLDRAVEDAQRLTRKRRRREP